MHPILRFVFRLPPTLLLLLLIVLGTLVLTGLTTFTFVAFSIYSYQLRSTNPRRRRIALAQLGIVEEVGSDGLKRRRRRIVGFFHPYCNAGGGGERVLWTAIAALQREEKDVVCAVYTGDAGKAGGAVGKEAMIEKVKSRFGIELDSETLLLIPLECRYLVEDGTWKRFTLLGQSLGSIWLTLEGLRKGLIPDIWIDTMGYAFAYPLVKVLCQIPVGSYTHYPTISTDMLRRVAERQQGHTNHSRVARSTILTYLKLIYYNIFAELYSLSLRRADVLMVNSSWTKAHIDRLVRPFGYRDDAPDEEVVEDVVSDRLRNRKATTTPVDRITTPRFKVATIVYPPCDTVAFSALSLDSREQVILSVAQFRPEKEHATQLHALRLFFDAHPEYSTGPKKWKLILAGSVRNAGDEARVSTLRTLSTMLNLTDNVEFEINVPYPRLIALFGQASIGLHTMIDEHFGITVVEFMAAGLIPLVHASAGPLLDIVLPYSPPSTSTLASTTTTVALPTGFHSTNAASFAENLYEIISLSEKERQAMRIRARVSAEERFSTASFEKGWRRNWERLVDFSQK